MKADLARQIGDAAPPVRRHLLREHLQAKILAALQRAGAMLSLAFHGGTALRFLHDLPRYSEDLDFALERNDRDYDFGKMLRRVRFDLERETFIVELKVKVRGNRVVESAFVRFPGLLHELGLSGHRGEVLSVKIEIDTRPPAGAGLTTTVVRRHELLHLQHHDRSSLLAGKLHAVLARPYTKGRDLYDLGWYLADRTWPEPNLEMLRAALDQTEWSGRRPSAGSWRSMVAERLEAVDWTVARRDVEPFLERREHLDLVDLDVLRRLLSPVDGP